MNKSLSLCWWSSCSSSSLFAVHMRAACLSHNLVPEDIKLSILTCCWFDWLLPTCQPIVKVEGRDVEETPQSKATGWSDDEQELCEGCLRCWRHGRRKKWLVSLSEFDPFGPITFQKPRGAARLNCFIPIQVSRRPKPEVVDSAGDRY